MSISHPCPACSSTGERCHLCQTYPEQNTRSSPYWKHYDAYITQLQIAGDKLTQTISEAKDAYQEEKKQIEAEWEDYLKEREHGFTS